MNYTLDAVKKALQESGQAFIYRKDADNDESQVNFLFVGEYEGKEVLFDSFMYILEMEFFSEIYEEAVTLTVEQFPKYDGMDFNALEGEHIDAMEQIAAELAKDDEYKVQELLEVEPNIEDSSIVNLDICLNRPEITEKDVQEFINSFKSPEGVKLDETLYAFDMD
ncbi:hypothetical protein [Sediminitomix flava]|uniref:Uncharacterized protein n=1 Tax=Sediminitomix flava TaxID=379075 RepID=A0A315ZF61_SEDFL|nr:hypothetical protein [Sediminitomix flava]PWJ44151.1 hypothetical protein BC781_101501 [Sediminitomix flava]